MWKIAIGTEATSAIFEPATTATQRAVFVCAHGAGGHMGDRGMLATTGALRDRGIGVVRFNFVYREKKSGRPDPMPRLMECVAAVVARTRAELNPPLLVTGGRSMGGRAASMLAAEGFVSDGLLLLAYPLHPAGRPDKPRTAHLGAISVPVLCFNGTRDKLCDQALMQAALEKVTARWDMHWLAGADHSFHVLKSFGITDADVMAEVGVVASHWVGTLS